MNPKFSFFDHMADAKFQAYGQTLKEAFANAALATASLMWDYEKVERKVAHPVEVQGKDFQQLIVNFLGEILYLMDAKSFILGAVEDVKIEKANDGFRLKALFQGDDHPEKYTIHGEVKAITYYEMKIEQNERVTLQVVVDM